MADRIRDNEGNASLGFQDLCLRQELLEYMDIHDNDASQSSQPSWGESGNQYKELQNHAKKTKPDEDDIPISQEEEAKFMQTFRKTRFYNDYRDRDSNRDNWRSNERSSYNRDNYRSSTDDKPYDLQKQFNDFMKS
ncbi:hypothetical protein Tco_0451381 [Tanacetum coccineum]